MSVQVIGCNPSFGRGGNSSAHTFGQPAKLLTAALPTHAQEPAPTPLERVYFVTTLVIFLSIPFLVGDQPQGADSLNPVKALQTMSGSGDVYKQLILGALYFGVVVALLRWARFRMYLFLGGPLLFLIAWCVISAAWAVDPNVSLRRSSALLGTVLLGLYAGLRFDLRTLLRLMSYVTAIVLMASIIVALIWPSVGLDYAGRLRGVFSHKNAVSGFAAIGFLVVTAQLVERNYRTKYAAIGDGFLIAVCILCMVLSQSAGAMPVLLIGLLLLPFTRLLRRADEGLLAMLPVVACAAIAGAALAVYYSEAIVALLGRDADISGRTLIWKFGLSMFLENAWIGYGYGTFWAGSQSPGGIFWSMSGLGAPHSHNGYLELALDVGAIGFGVILVTIVGLGAKLGWLVRRGNEPFISWAVAFLGFFLATNLVETQLWVGNQLHTVLFVYLIVYASSAVRRTVSNLDAARRIERHAQDMECRSMSRLHHVPARNFASANIGRRAFTDSGAAKG